MNIFIGYAHTLEGLGSGAIGYINESKESRIISDMVAKYLREMGHTVTVTGIKRSSNYLEELVPIANKQNYDVVVQIHFNSYQTTNSVKGTETYYYSTDSKGKKIAEQVNNKLTTLYKNRGIKINDKLYWIRNTKPTAILVEVCFVDSLADTKIYNANKEKTAQLIAEGITNQTYKPTSNNNSNSDKLYRVVVGSYHLDNARKMEKELEDKGYKDTFIVEV